MNPKLIVFDLNKTLIKENSWLDLNLAMGVTQAEDDQLMAWGEADIISDQQGQDILCAIYNKRGEPTRERIWEILSHYTYLPDAQPTVAKLREAGFVLAILSGSIDMLVDHVGEELEIEHRYASNKFVFDENNRLKQIQAPQKDTLDKAAQLRKLCQELGVPLDEVLAVGDGLSDSEIFKITGNGVTFAGSVIEHDARFVIGSLGELPALVGVK